MAAAYIAICVEAGQASSVLDSVRSVDGVKQAHTCWGQPDIFAFCEVDSEHELAAVVLETLHRTPGVRSTETHLVVEM